MINCIVKCLEELYAPAECYSSESKVVSDSKCNSETRPEPTRCYEQVGCEVGSWCNNDECQLLEVGLCFRDADCIYDEMKPYCSRKGKCDENDANVAQLSSFMVIIAVIIIGLFAF